MVAVQLSNLNAASATGQILFLGVVLAAMAVLRRAPVAWPAGSWCLAPYAIGSAAAFWAIQRVGSFL